MDNMITNETNGEIPPSPHNLEQELSSHNTNSVP